MIRHRHLWPLLFVAVFRCTFGDDSKLDYHSVDTWDTTDNGVRAYETEICRSLRCRRGEECVVRGHLALCQCRQTCPNHVRPLCGSDGVTYQSHCYLYRQACASRIKIHPVSHGKCPEIRIEPLSESNSSQEMVVQDKPEIETVLGLTVSAGTTKINVESATGSSTSTEQQTTTSTTTSGSTTTIKQQCNKEDLLFVPTNLLLYFHSKYTDSEAKLGKTHLVQLMRDQFDLNSDGTVTREELHLLDQEKKFEKLLPTGCRMIDLLINSDTDGDDALNVAEFLKLFGVATTATTSRSSVKYHTVEVGDQYQLFCDLEKNNAGSLKVTWYRYDVPLVNVAPYEFEVSADGSLYLTPASLTHNGNFTCKVPAGAGGTSSSGLLQQLHIVSVYERPRVTITPDFRLWQTGESGYLRCEIHGGYPISEIYWEKNERLYRENVSVLHFQNVHPLDTGSYRCIAKSPVDNLNKNDLISSSASVVVRDRYDQPEVSLRYNYRHEKEAFAVLYKGGIRFYRADDCAVTHAIPSSIAIKEEKDASMCNVKENCQWSDALVTSSSTYLYAALADQKTVVKVNVSSGAVEQAFYLNHAPKRLYYLEQEDSVWIESWRQDDGKYRTVQVVRSASRFMRHSLTHALPLRDEFDSVYRLFLPTNNGLKYGYITHWNEDALHKIDVHTLKIVSRVSLVPYDCQPANVAFAAQSGLVIVQCVSTHDNASIGGGQLILDYISDATLSYESDVHGEPIVTEDGRWLINVDAVLGRIFVHKIDAKSVKLVATIDEFLPLSAWTMHVADVYRSWDIYASPNNGASLLKIGIPSAKIERLQALQLGSDSGKSSIVSSNSQNRFMLLSSDAALHVIDLLDPANINCKINLNATQKLVWVTGTEQLRN